MITGSALCLSRGVERRRSADPPSTNIDYKSGGGGSNGDGGSGGGSNEDFIAMLPFDLVFLLAAGCRQ